MRIGHSTAVLVAAVSLALMGCSGINDVFKDKGTRIDYKKNERSDPLEVPPDLTRPTDKGDLVVPELAGTLASDYGAKASQPANESVLPKQEKVHVMRDGVQRWLVIDGPAEQVWARVREFWIQNGFELKVDNAQIGVMETGWMENRADIPEDFIRGLVTKVFANAYSAPTRDKFRVRLERGERGATELYLSHYGVEQVTQGENQILWQPRPADPELVNELLNRIMVYLGAKQEQAQAVAVAAQKQETSNQVRLVEQDGPALVVNEGFARAWRRAGLALDKLGFIVEDRNRSTGVYYVRHAEQLDPQARSKGWFSRLFSKSEPEGNTGRRLQVVLRDQGDATLVILLDAEGKRAADAEAKDLLSRLRGELI